MTRCATATVQDESHPALAAGRCRLTDVRVTLYVASLRASDDAILDAGVSMRTTVTIDDDLLARASELTGITERSALLRDGLETLIRVESAKRLAALGGSDRDATAAPRRRDGAK
jgi:Arc/MetJ family transcription regulator